MSAAVPAKLRDAQITQFARRASQLEKFKPIITYWLRFYITQRILAKGLHTADQECTAYTASLMDTLEQTKAEHPTEDALLDDVAAYAYCEQFALQTFARGDNQIRTNSVTEATADTLLAASTFLELLSIWKNPPEAEIKSKLTYAKYHALRIAKAIKAGEDPNLSNPKPETPAASSPVALDPNDPEVRRINEGGEQPSNPYQPYVETAPNTSTQPSPTFSATRGPQTPPPNLPSAPTGYSQPSASTYPSHQDVSPISQPEKSRQGSDVSVGGGYFPRVDVPTFTADTLPSGLPTAPSVSDGRPESTFETAPAPPPPQPPQPPQPLEPQSFYTSHRPASPFQPNPVQQPTPQVPPPQNDLQRQPTGFAQSPPPVPSQQPPASQTNLTSPPGQYTWASHTSQPTPHSQPPPQTFAPQVPQVSQQPQPPHQGPLRTDEESIMDAQKHAKWAISALNFDDVTTAVQELRIALRALGAN